MNVYEVVHTRVSQISKCSSKNILVFLFVKETITMPILLESRAMQSKKRYIKYHVYINY